MDTTKPSTFSEASHVNNGEGSGADQDEAAEWDKYPNGVPFTAATLDVHQGSADFKHKFHTAKYRRTKQKVMANFATVGKGKSGATKPRTALKQVLFSQGASDKNPISEDQLQMEALKQALDAYPVPADLRWSWEEPSQGTKLENSWTDIVDSHSTMSKIQRHQQEALWEFVHTELTYINKLTIVNDLVIAALVNLLQNGFLPEIKPESLFSNLPVVLNAHRQFWQEVIFPMLQNTRRTGRPFDPRSLEAGCLQFRERFASYLPYNQELENMLQFSQQQMDTNPHFHVYLKWVETHPLCNRMRLGEMQAKPHQRITKYPLLLKAVLKYTQEPHVQQTIRGMLSSVNAFLRRMDGELALSVSAQKVDGYEVPGVNEEIDKHLQEICHFDLTTPMVGVGPHIVRKLLLEESLKIRRRKENKLEVVVALLFSDVLLVTKVQKKSEKLRVAFPPLALDKTCCVALKDGYSFLLVEVSELGCANNFHIFVTTTAESCSTWVSTIQQAKDTLKTLREDETSRQLERERIRQLDSSPLVSAIQPSNLSANSSAETPTHTHSRSMYGSEGQNLFMGEYPEVDYPTDEQGDATHTQGLAFGGPKKVWSTPHTNSSSNSDSDSNQKLEGSFDPSHTNSDTSHRVLKVGSLRMFWNMYENHASLEPEPFPELPQEIPGERGTLKSQRSAPVPDIHELHGNSTSEAPRTDMELSPWYTHRQHARRSPVEGVLERAKSGRDGGNNDGNAEDKKYSHISVDELNVDWPGWCFDEEEVMDYLGPTDHNNRGTGMTLKRH